MEMPAIVSYVSLGAWVVSFAWGVLKARDWVETVALNALKSGEGRTVMVDAVSDRHSRVEDKLDALTQHVTSIADRLEGRIEAVAVRMESRLDRLDKDAHQLDVRLSIVESASK
jgi:hypothetical protein